MDIIMRLYPRTDLDLMLLNSCRDFSIPVAIRAALAAAVRGVSMSIVKPEITREDIERNYEKPAVIHVYLNEGRDDDLIKVAEGITPRVRCAVLKNLVRFYMESPVFDAYFPTDLPPTPPRSTTLISTSPGALKDYRKHRDATFELLSLPLPGKKVTTPATEAAKGLMKEEEGKEIEEGRIIKEERGKENTADKKDEDRKKGIEDKAADVQGRRMDAHDGKKVSREERGAGSGSDTWTGRKDNVPGNTQPDVSSGRRSSNAAQDNPQENDDQMDSLMEQLLDMNF